MIFITVGTHYQPFDRLVRAAEALAGIEEVVLQRGASTIWPEGCEVVDYLSPDAMASTMKRARIVISHTGPATLFEAASLGHVPIVVPRDPSFGEHVDDHQLRFARRLEGRLLVVRDPRDLPRMVRDFEERVQGRAPLGSRPERTEAFAAGVEQVCLRAVSKQSPAAARRDTMRAFRRWIFPPP